MSPASRAAATASGGADRDGSPFALGLLLRRAHDQAARELATAVAPFGLGLRHFAVMMALSEHGAMSQRELVDALGKDGASMVRVVDDLEHAGFAVRQPVANDRRRHAVELTGRGVEVFAAAHVNAEPIAARLSARLGPGEAELLLDLLHRFCADSTQR